MPKPYVQIYDLRCPTCGSGEMHPTEHKLLIRGLKVCTEGYWWSQCLVCAGHYDAQLNDTPGNYDPKLGWF